MLGTPIWPKQGLPRPKKKYLGLFSHNYQSANK